MDVGGSDCREQRALGAWWVVGTIGNLKGAGDRGVGRSPSQQTVNEGGQLWELFSGKGNHQRLRQDTNKRK